MDNYEVCPIKLHKTNKISIYFLYFFVPANNYFISSLLPLNMTSRRIVLSEMLNSLNRLIPSKPIQYLAAYIVGKPIESLLSIRSYHVIQRWRCCLMFSYKTVFGYFFKFHLKIFSLDLLTLNLLGIRICYHFVIWILMN